MAERTEKVTKVVEEAPVGGTSQTEVREVSQASVSGSTLAVRIIWFIAGTILIILAFRFVLTLLGANRSNGFADFIYTVSYPFVAPFYGLFSYEQQYQYPKVEGYTLIAMAVYAILAWGLSKLVTINRPR